MFFVAEKIERRLAEIQKSIYRETIPISDFKIKTGDCPGAEKPDFDDRSWDDFRIGEYWGGYDVTTWFRTWVAIPQRFFDKKCSLRFLVGPRNGGGSTAETLVYANGAALQAVDIWHEEIWLPPELSQAGRILIALKAWSGVIRVPVQRHFKLAELAWIDEPAERFYFLANTLLKSAQVIDENDLRRTQILRTLNEAFQCIDFLKPGSEMYYQSIGNALGCLESAYRSFQTKAEIKPTVFGIGHAHIDLAWLWRVRHSREKASRTFATALHLMRQYPDFRFMHSSPQLYQYLKQDHPEIFARVKEQVQAGRWEITGGMWVEADTNLTGGEALIRQILFGKRFIREEFGKETSTLWLPDVFGYSAALPQIMKKSGLKYFVTTKISWSQFNRFPYDTFHWRGLDGSEILAHFVTTPEPNSRSYTYNGQLDPWQVKGIWDQYRQKDQNDELLFLYGWGDGGGGPTREMLESAQVMKNIPGIPRVELGTAESYLSRLERRTAQASLPVWDGELYLEYHRGTYTSQAWIKRANRRAERLFHNAEWLCSLADLVSKRDEYPAANLRQGWELLLLNQFHDILPGSSIHEVYEDSRVDFAAIEQIGLEAIRKAESAITGALHIDRPALVAFNPLSWERSGLVELPWSEDLAGSGGQIIERGGEKRVLIQTPSIPSMGVRVIPLGVVDHTPAEDNVAVEDPVQVSSSRMGNRFCRIELNPDGQITRIWDKSRRRDVLLKGQRGNVFQIFEDKPMDFDAWDIDIYYQEKMQEIHQLVDAVVEENGPLRGVLRLTWKFSDSTIVQRMTLYRSSPRIDFHTEVDWHERQTLLKVAFPVAIRAARATYDIQFGAVERPTHWNTSWDWARFEVVGHKWADLSEGNYGVSLLNDCKYGYDIHDQSMRLTLIKSAIDPDPLADQGQHEFTYSLLPHAGDWRTGGVVAEGYDLNNPVWAVKADPNQGRTAAEAAPFVSVDLEGVIVETVKKAEDGQGWIVRVYEAQQSRGEQGNLKFGELLRGAVECNLVEEGETPVLFEGKKLTFAIDPYEIKTFKVWFDQ